MQAKIRHAGHAESQRGAAEQDRLEASHFRRLCGVAIPDAGREHLFAGNQIPKLHLLAIADHRHPPFPIAPRRRAHSVVLTSLACRVVQPIDRSCLARPDLPGEPARRDLEPAISGRHPCRHRGTAFAGCRRSRERRRRYCRAAAASASVPRRCKAASRLQRASEP